MKQEIVKKQLRQIKKPELTALTFFVYLKVLAEMGDEMTGFQELTRIFSQKSAQVMDRSK